MAKDLGGYSLPYSYPLNYTVHYTTCGLISGLGNYAMAEVFENGRSVHKHCYPNKESFKSSFNRAMEMAKFLSRLDLDFISKSDFDYIHNSEEYDIVTSLFSMCDSDFRESLRANTLVRHISPYGERHYQADSENGLITQKPFGKFAIDIVEMESPTIISLHYTSEDSRLKGTKILHINERLVKCFFTMAKFNILLDIVRDKAYWHLSSGLFAANRHTVITWLDYHTKDYIEKLGYLKIQ